MRVKKEQFYIRGVDFVDIIPQYDNKFGVNIRYPHKQYCIVQGFENNKLVYFETPRFISGTSLIACCFLTFPDELTAQRFLFRNDLIACVRRIRRKKTKYFIL